MALHSNKDCKIIGCATCRLKSKHSKTMENLKHLQWVDDRKLNPLLEACRELLKNYEKCPQNPHNNPTIGHNYLNDLRRSLIDFEKKEKRFGIW